MALIRCIECGEVLSDKADKCPKCGCPTKYMVPIGVNLGLPSGTIWAENNIGATQGGRGYFYAWGETTIRGDFRKESYLYLNTPKILSIKNDAVAAYYGNGWQMPTKEDFEELINCCEWELKFYYGGTRPYYEVNSYVTGERIYISAAGYLEGDNLYEMDKGYYWTSSVFDSQNAWGLTFGSSNNIGLNKFARYCGLCIRPVWKPQQ